MEGPQDRPLRITARATVTPPEAGRQAAGRSQQIRISISDHPLRKAGVRTAARGLRSVVRLIGAGGGTSLPGLFLERFDPTFLKSTASAANARVILVTGTNGKTTTASMIRHILRATGSIVAGNEGGSNMTRGIFTAFLDVTPATDYIVLEVDEAVAPHLVEVLRPDLLVLTNVFRDQLDRFGEAESVAALLGRSAALLQADARVVFNLDDPLLGFAVKDRLGPEIGFGVDPQTQESPESFSSEPQICPRCGGDFDYTVRTIGHLGTGACSHCGWTSGHGGTRARIVEDRGLAGVDIEIDGWRASLAVGGIHAAYNSAAAVAAAGGLGIPVEDACRSLAGFVPRFGRDEVLDVAGHPVHVLLMKNPAGANVVINEACSDPRTGSAVVAVNDLAADGRDISWIWDADFESLVEARIPLFPSGRRAQDVAVRIKYAGGTPEAAEANIATAVRQAAERCAPGQEAVTFATYTAMLAMRRGLTRAWRHRRANAFQ
ncbi:MAG TPA: MurT ligase domain-containing protein [Actinomycetota bacterium]|nr:MurT ligase domain-containing protein [Actinomycetota bacterium]